MCMKECRKERQKRLIEVYDHLRKHFGIHTKTGFAEALEYGRTSMSAAINGNEDYLTDDLFENICEKYPGVFNLDYLLNGTGDLLTPQEDVKSSEIDQTVMPSHDESLANLLELYAQRIRLVDDLRQSLKEELVELRALKDELVGIRKDHQEARELITTLHDCLFYAREVTRQEPVSISRAADDGDY